MEKTSCDAWISHFNKREPKYRQTCRNTSISITSTGSFTNVFLSCHSSEILSILRTWFSERRLNSGICLHSPHSGYLEAASFLIKDTITFSIWMQANRIARFKAACAAADIDCNGFDMKCAKVKMGIYDGKPPVQ